MLKKRGQLTLFVIIAVIITSAIIGYFMFNTKILSSPPENEKVVILRNNALDCFNQVYVMSLMTVGFQGGLIDVTDGINNGFANIPYYYKEGQVNTPTLKVIESEMANYIDTIIPSCLNYNDVIINSEELGINITPLDLVEGNFYDYKISYNQHKTKVAIKDKEVIFTSDIDLNIEDNEGKTYIIELKKYPLTIDSDLFRMHKIASYIATSLKEDNENICLTCVAEMAKNNDLTIDIMGYLNPNDELIVISNNITSMPIVFQFANKYSVTNNEETLF